MQLIKSWLYNLSLSARLTIAYTAIIMLVVGSFATAMYVQLQAAQRSVSRERLADLVGLTVAQIDGDFHSLIVAPGDETGSYYRIIQTTLANIQGISPAITRISTLRQDDKGHVSVVVDQHMHEGRATAIGQPFGNHGPLLAAGLPSITGTSIEADLVTMPGGEQRFYGYAPIFDQYGRTDGVLVVELDASTVVASEQRMRNIVLFGLLLTLPLVVLLGVVLVRRTTAPVAELLRGAERITQGRLDYRVPVHSGDDLGILAMNFNTMADTLQARIAAEQQAGQLLSESHQQLQRYSQSLEQAVEAQQRLSETVRQMALPIIPIADQIIVLPLIGTLDSERARQMTETLLEGVTSHRARLVIIDITGVSMVDTQVAQTFIQTAQAARLLGAQVMLTGIKPQVAETLVGLGIDMKGILTQSSLQEGIAAFLNNKLKLRGQQQI
jgi:anti-anti-sigma regulatory factor/HAMP domain-containing protein